MSRRTRSTLTHAFAALPCPPSPGSKTGSGTHVATNIAVWVCVGVCGCADTSDALRRSLVRGWQLLLRALFLGQRMLEFTLEFARAC